MSFKPAKAKASFEKPLAKFGGRAFTYALLMLTSLSVLFPLFIAFSLALQGATVAPSIVPDLGRLDWGIFSEVFRKEPNLVRWIINSLVVSSLITLGVLVTSSLAAYALASPNFKGKTIFLFLSLGTLMIPFETTIIPNYLFVNGLGWKDSYQGLVAPFLASGFGVFLLRQYFLIIPKDLYEAAEIDGCGRFRYLWSILLPLSRPALATLVVYTFLNSWNGYYWPLLITDRAEWRTTQIGITIFRSSEAQTYNLQMAATLIVILPTFILLILGQRQLVRGLTSGAVKG